MNNLHRAAAADHDDAERDQRGGRDRAQELDHQRAAARRTRERPSAVLSATPGLCNGPPPGHGRPSSFG
jgi:hypothetical protein